MIFMGTSGANSRTAVGSTPLQATGIRWILLVPALAACARGGEEIGVSLITKNSSNPFFVSMQQGARREAATYKVDLTIAAGKRDGDEETQVQAIENAIARGERGILITPNGPGVNAALRKAREAGLYVIALDTPTDPPEVVDITFATDNFKAGALIGHWSRGTLRGKAATIAVLDLFADKLVSVDVERNQGFLTGMGISTADPKRKGDEPREGRYADGAYTIACSEPTLGAEDGGRTAMEACLARNAEINIVYTVNEPSALGAFKALQAAGREKGVLIVSVDGGCAGVKLVKEGIVGATAQQYPLRMAAMGVEAIARIAMGGATPHTSAGLAFFDTGVALVTDQPVPGLESIDTGQGLAQCWG
ncbi:MAG TPA: substrate-binding domain-containing protein [Vicinamibacteria bacterium]|nr:substrate-binding domain-containing protein [Vicinamibacteria bacterium]